MPSSLNVIKMIPIKFAASTRSSPSTFPSARVQRARANISSPPPTPPSAPPPPSPPPPAPPPRPAARPPPASRRSFSPQTVRYRRSLLQGAVPTPPAQRCYWSVQKNPTSSPSQIRHIPNSRYNISNIKGALGQPFHQDKQSLQIIRILDSKLYIKGATCQPSRWDEQSLRIWESGFHLSLQWLVLMSRHKICHIIKMSQAKDKSTSHHSHQFAPAIMTFWTSETCTCHDSNMSKIRVTLPDIPSDVQAAVPDSRNFVCTNDLH